jgi:APA family basic amino acid/polyamine antiporter
MGFVTSCFERKPIAQMVPEGEGVLRRALGAGDLIMLSIGAVIGAGIFGSIGTAAAGEFDAAGHIIRTGAGPAIVFSFILAVLRGSGVDDPAGRQRVRVFVRDAG